MNCHERNIFLYHNETKNDNLINRYDDEDMNEAERAEIRVRLSGEQMRRLAMENFSSQNVLKAVSAKTRKARVQIEKEKC